MDDYERNHAQHDICIRAVLHHLQEVGVTLKIQECEFLQARVNLLRHIVNAHGVHADPAKIKAITQFPTLSSITELQHFLGMVNQLGKFIPGLADLNEPLCQPLHKETIWYWGEDQRATFQQFKDALVFPRLFLTCTPAALLLLQLNWNYSFSLLALRQRIMRSYLLYLLVANFCQKELCRFQERSTCLNLGM